MILILLMIFPAKIDHRSPGLGTRAGAGTGK
jgi:hypothetical protein